MYFIDVREDGRRSESDRARNFEVFTNQRFKNRTRKILKALLQRKDCVAVLPTGYGKSLPYQIAISVKRTLLRDDGEKFIVCCPLVAAIM